MDVEGSRRDSRERQQRSRVSRNLAKGAAGAVMSRAGLDAQAIDLTRDILRIWDKQAAMSRAGLAREVRILSGLKAQKLGQGGTETEGFGVRAKISGAALGAG